MKTQEEEEGDKDGGKDETPTRHFSATTIARIDLFIYFKSESNPAEVKTLAGHRAKKGFKCKAAPKRANILTMVVVVVVGGTLLSNQPGAATFQKLWGVN